MSTAPFDVAESSRPAAGSSSRSPPTSTAPSAPRQRRSPRRSLLRQTARLVGRIAVAGLAAVAAIGSGIRGFLGPRLAWVLVRAVQPLLPKLIVHLVHTRRLDRLDKLQSTGISLAPALRESVRIGDPRLVHHFLRREVEPDAETLAEALRTPTPRAEPIRSLLRHHVKPRATALDMALGTDNDELAGALLKRGVAPGPRALHWIPIRRVGAPMPGELWLRLIENLDPKYLSPSAFERLVYIAPIPVLERALQRTTHEKSQCRRAVFEGAVISDRPEVAQYAMNLGESYDPEQCLRILGRPEPAADGTPWGARLGRALELLAATDQTLTLQQGFVVLERIYLNEPSLLNEHRAALNVVLTRVLTPHDLPQLDARANALARAAAVGLRLIDLPQPAVPGPFISAFPLHATQTAMPGAESFASSNGSAPHPPSHDSPEPGFVIH